MFRPLIGLRDVSESTDTPLTYALVSLLDCVNSVSTLDNEWENTKLAYLSESLFTLQELSRDMAMDDDVVIRTETLEKLHTGINAFDQIRRNVKAQNPDEPVLSPLLTVSLNLNSLVVSRQIGYAPIGADKLPPFQNLRPPQSMLSHTLKLHTAILPL